MRAFWKGFCSKGWIAIGCFAALISVVHAKEEYQESVKKILKNLGKPISRTQSPTVYSLLEGVVKDLAEVQARTTHKKHLLLYELYLIENPIANAFVYSHNKDGVPQQRNAVFITTGHLRELFEAADFEAAFNRIVGTLLHEMGHPNDKIAELSLEKTYGGLWSQQAREIRADADGTLLAREAGYPPSAVYEIKQHLLEKEYLAKSEKNPSSALARAAHSFVSSHPNLELNQTLNRALLTGLRFEYGSIEAAQYQKRLREATRQKRKVMAEIQALPNTHFQYIPRPATLDQTIKRLTRLLTTTLAQNGTIRNDNPSFYVPVNQLLLWIDEHLADLQDQHVSLSTDQIEALSGLWPQLLRAECVLKTSGYETTWLTLTEEEIQAKLTPIFHSGEKRKLRGHGHALQSIEYYDSPDYLHVIDAFSSPPIVGKGDPSYRDASARTRYLPPNRVVERTDVSKPYLSYREQRLPEFEFPSGYQLAKKIQGTRSLEEYLDQVITQVSQQNYRWKSGHPILLPVGILYQTLRTNTENWKQQLAAQSPEVQRYYEAIAKTLWHKRGHYGAMDARGAVRLLWPWVMELHGLSQQEGEESLAKAIKTYAETDPKAISVLSPLKYGVNSGYPLSDYFENILSKDPPDLTKNPGYQESSQLASALRPDRGQLERLERGLQTLTDPVQRQQWLMTELIKIKKKQYGEAEEFLHWPYQSTATEDLGAGAMRLLIDEGVLDDYSDYLRILWDPENQSDLFSLLERFPDLYSRETNGPWLRERLTEEHFNYVEKYGEQLRLDLDSAVHKAKSAEEKKKALFDFVRTVLDPTQGHYKSRPSANYSLYLLKDAAVTHARALALTPTEGLRIYGRLTATGGNASTDRYLRETLLPHFGQPGAPNRRATLTWALENGRIQDRSDKLAFAKELLEPSILKALKESEQKPALSAIVSRLSQYVPDAFYTKDAYLEDLAWRFELRGPDVLRYIESHKSSNPMHWNPGLARWGSLLSNQISNLSQSSKHDLITYLQDPTTRPFPKTVEQELLSNEKEKFLERLGERRDSPLSAKISRTMHWIREQIIALATDSESLERVPVIDVLLTGSSDSIAKDPGFPLTTIRRHLGYPENSRQERALVAYLKVIPEYERSITLSYLISQGAEEGAGIKEQFLAFRAPGIRGGQEAYVWKLLGQNHLRQLEGLFDEALPQSLTELQEILSTRYPDRKFRVLKRLGSASTATVATVAWIDTNGKTRQGVVSFRRPRAREQVNTHFTTGKQYIEELVRAGLLEESQFATALIEAQHQQLLVELDFRRVADGLKKLSKTYEGRTSGSWTFRVPKVLSEFEPEEDLLFMEKAEGVTFRKSSDQAKKDTGEAILRTLVRSMVDGTPYQANANPGNFMLDPTGKTIWVIDGGQVQELPSGSKHKAGKNIAFVRFLAAIEKRDEKEAVHFGQQLASNTPSSGQVAELIQNLRAIFNRTDSADFVPVLRETVEAFIKARIPIDDRYTFIGGLKSLLDAQRAGFVPESQFAEIVRDEIRKSLGNKKIQLLASEVTYRCSKLRSHLMQLLKK